MRYHDVIAWIRHQVERAQDFGARRREFRATPSDMIMLELYRRTLTYISVTPELTQSQIHEICHEALKAEDDPWTRNTPRTSRTF